MVAQEMDSDDNEDLMRDLSSDSENEQEQQPTKKKQEEQHRSDDDDDDDNEMDYEMQPRRVAAEWSRKDYVNKLPIKLPGGKLAQQDEEEEGSSGDDEEEKVAAPQPVATDDTMESEDDAEEKPVLTKKQLILTKKEELANLASALQEDPEQNVSGWERAPQASLVLTCCFFVWHLDWETQDLPRNLQNR